MFSPKQVITEAFCLEGYGSSFVEKC